jgi:hypothetical protein
MGHSKGKKVKGKFRALSVYIKKTERPQINDLMLHLKILEKQEQAKLRTSRRREIIKIRAEINEIEKKRKPCKESKKQKIKKPLANLTKMRMERPKLVKSEMKNWR